MSLSSTHVSFTVRMPLAKHRKLKDRALKRGVPLNYEVNETIDAGLKARKNLFKKLVEKHII